MKEMNTRVINKHDYEVNWVKATNFVPKRGELIIYDAEFDDLGNTVALPTGRTEPIFYARYKIGDGVTNVNSLPFANANAEEVDLSNYIQYKDILQTTNPFGGKSLYISKIDDALYAADKRFDVKFDLYNSDGSLYWESDAATIAKLFNGNYEDFGTVAEGKYGKITITLPDYRALADYPYGAILLSFYYDMIPESVTARAYCNYEPQGVGWKNLPVGILNREVGELGSQTNAVYSIRNDFYQISQIEITVTAPAAHAAYITTIEMKMDRPAFDKTPFLSKYGPETLYYDLTAPNFIGNLTGTASNHYTKEEIDEQINQLSSEIEDLKDGNNKYTNVLSTAVSRLDILQVLTGTDGSVGYLNKMRFSGSSNTYIDQANTDTTGLMSCAVGDIIRLKNVTMYIDSAYVHGGITFYASDGTYLTGINLTTEELLASYNIVKDSSGNIIQFTIPTYAEIGRFSITCQDINESSIITVNEEIVDSDDTRITELEASVADLDTRVSILENATPSAPDEDTIPSYWQSALEEGAQAINEKLCVAGMNKSAFLFYSDAHWDYGSQMSPRLLKYLYKHTGMTKTFFGGDIVNNEASDYNTMKYLWEWRNQLKDLPNHHSVVGNHDDGNATNNLFTEQYVYGYLLAAEETPNIVRGGVTWYYIDNGAEKTRYIFLDTAYKGFNTDQQEFLKETLISTPSGWHIVVISHIWYGPDYDQYNVRPIPIAGMTPDAKSVTAMLDLYNSRSGVYADCDGWVEFCIGGHVHRDYDGTTATGIPIILVETDS
jgi:predicted MPP superfamily phosphohydrolase